MKFTKEYFLKECCSLRKMWGTLDFWKDKERASRSMEALLYVYLNSEDIGESEICLMEVMKEEFDRRLLFSLIGV